MLRRAVVLLVSLAISQAASAQTSTHDATIELKLIATLTDHESQPRAIDYSPDGKTFASWSADGKIQLWDAATNQRISTLNLQTESLGDVEFSPDGRFLATGGLGGAVTIRDMQQKQTTHFNTPGGGTITQLAWSPDGKTLITAHIAGIGFLNVSNGDFEYIDFEKEYMIFPTMILSPDGKRIAVWTSRADVLIISMDQKQLLSRFVAIAPVAENDFSAQSLDDLVYAPDGQTLAACYGIKGESTVRTWHADKKTLLKTFEGDHGDISSIAYSPDGKLLAGAGFHLVIWDAQTGKERARCELDQVQEKILSPGVKITTVVPILSRSVAFVTFAPGNSRRLATIWGDKTIRVFELAKPQE